MKRLLSLITLSCLGCSLQHNQVVSFTDNGLFKYGTNRGSQFFPAYLYDFVDTTAHHRFQAAFNETTLRKNREENLCAKYSGKDVIRAVYTSAFDFGHHLVVTLVHERSDYYVTVKESYQASILIPGNNSNLSYYLTYDSAKGIYEKVGYDSKQLMEFSNWVERSREPIEPVISEEKYEATKEIWNETVRRLNEGYFWMQPSAPYNGTDGSFIFVETHFSDGYYAVERWSPKTGSPLASVSDYLFLLCGKWSFTSDRSRFRSIPDSLVIKDM